MNGSIRLFDGQYSRFRVPQARIASRLQSSDLALMARILTAAGNYSISRVVEGHGLIMKKLFIGFIAFLFLFCCKGEVYTSSKVVTPDGGDKITIAARSVNDTSVAWATRGVGLDFNRGHVLSLTVGDRPTVVLERISDEGQAPDQAAIRALVEGTQVNRSPDGGHLLVAWNHGGPKTELFHLLSKGQPFQLSVPGAEGKIDWSKMPKAETLAQKALALAARDPGKCAIPGERGFWAALEDGAPGTGLEGPLLNLWPACWKTWAPVANITRNRPDVTGKWKKTLSSKLDKYMTMESGDHDFQAAVGHCLFLNDKDRLMRVAARLTDGWPGNDDIQQFALESFDRFPEEIRSAWLKKAMAPFKGRSFEERARIVRVMRKWTDCDAFQKFASTHLGVEQKRPDCDNWPLKRFPEGGTEEKQLKEFIRAGDRNQAIRLVRTTTGWEYMKAVDYVDKAMGK